MLRSLLLDLVIEVLDCEVEEEVLDVVCLHVHHGLEVEGESLANFLEAGTVISVLISSEQTVNVERVEPGRAAIAMDELGHSMIIAIVSFTT